MGKEDLEEIINSHKWVKVKKFNPNPSGINWLDDCGKCMEAYTELEKHHREETEFLINKCRELAKELLNQMKDE